MLDFPWNSAPSRWKFPRTEISFSARRHFIKSVEDLYEALVNTVPQMKFGIAFNEASGPCLTRVDGNDDALKALAAKNATASPPGTSSSS